MRVRFGRLLALFCAAGGFLPLLAQDAQAPRRTPSVSPAIRALLPAKAVVRANLQTAASGGEQITVYSTSSDYLEAESYILITRNGRRVRRLNVGNIVSGGPVDFKKAVFLRAGGLNQLLFAIGIGVDQSATCFFALDLQSGEYKIVWKHTTMQGQIILDSPFAGYTLWEACCLKDDPPLESCVWCQHRYRIRKYTWSNGAFVSGKPRLTREHINPERFADKPIIVPPA